MQKAVKLTSAMVSAGHLTGADLSDMARQACISALACNYCIVTWVTSGSWFAVVAICNRPVSAL